MRVSEFSGSRDNNFSLIRLLAAMAVVASHSYFIVLGSADLEPWHRQIGSSPATLALDVFFVISGFLVTRSLLFKKSVSEFISARTLRIFPGLIANLFFIAIVVGPIFAVVPYKEYFIDKELITYVLINLRMTSLPYPSGSLPGVFITNGSLWSLPVEICCYVVLLCAWIMYGSYRRKSHLSYLILVACALFSGFAVHRYFQSAGLHLLWMFLSGVLIYRFRHRVTISWSAFGFVMVILIGSTIHRTTFQAALLLVGPYAVFCAAYLPAGRIRKFNRLGDYSYGTYIFGYPIQYAVSIVASSISVLVLNFVSITLTLIMAFISWHLVESPALKLVPVFSEWLRRAGLFIRSLVVD